MIISRKRAGQTGLECRKENKILVAKVIKMTEANKQKEEDKKSEEEQKSFVLFF